MFGFLGANGAGKKTTTFRMILGIMDATEGDITWNGGKKIDYSTSPLLVICLKKEDYIQN